MKRRQYDPAVASLMAERLVSGLDPITGRPVLVSWPIRYCAHSGSLIDATGRAVMVGSAGDYVYTDAVKDFAT